MRTQGVLFDLYGTLVVYGEMEKAWDAWYQVIYDTFRMNGLSLDTAGFRPFCIGFFERPEPTHAGGDLTVVERRLHRLAQEMDVVIPREQALRAVEQSLDVWHDYVHLDPEAPAVLEKIGRNRSLALVSNFDYAPYVEDLMSRWNLEPLFDAILVSDSVGVKKPHPGIFEQALRELDIPATSAIHVGDSQEDIDGAAGAGIRPVWIDRQRKDRWRAKPESDVMRISSLAELLDLLD